MLNNICLNEGERRSTRRNLDQPFAPRTQRQPNVASTSISATILASFWPATTARTADQESRQ
jgi:hypothetical protein